MLQDCLSSFSGIYLRGREGRTPPETQFFQLHAVFGTIGVKIVCWRPPEELAPPPRGIHGHLLLTDHLLKSCTPITKRAYLFIFVMAKHNPWFLRNSWSSISRDFYE